MWYRALNTPPGAYWNYYGKFTQLAFSVCHIEFRFYLDFLQGIAGDKGAQGDSILESGPMVIDFILTCDISYKFYVNDFYQCNTFLIFI